MVLFPSLSASALVLLSLTQLTSGEAPDAEYDFVVIGSGPGGGPLAAKLSRAGHTVLILEAGSDQSSNINSEIPSLFPLAYTDPSMTWDFFVRNYHDEERVLRNNHLTWRKSDGSYYVGNTPPEGAELLGLYYPRGGTLGGSSAINAMGPVLPSDSDWELIADLTGDASWSPENMRELFTRIERNHYLPPGTPGHGFSGYFDTNAPDDSAWVGYDDALAVLETISESLGGETNVTSDPNALSPTRDQDEGVFGGAQHVDENMRRFSSRDYILETAESYPLTLKLNALATKLIFDEEEEDRVVGVEYLEGESVYRADPRNDGTQEGTPGKVYAKEVIVSAGVFNSPQILKLSGIGPRDELEALGIEVRVDLPGVGANLQDNQEVPIVGHAAANFSTPAPDPDAPQCTFGAPGDPCVEAWKNGEGPYMEPGQANDIFRISAYSEEGERDMFATGGTFAIRGFWPLTDSVPADPPNTFALSTVKIHPRSVKGSVLLQSADPRDPPSINFNLFSSPEADADLDAYLDTIKWVRRTYAQVPAPIGPITLVEPPCDGEPDEEGGCDDEVDKEWVMDQFFGHHATSTCALGSVIDEDFRVKGVKGVRVVDASSFPRTPGAFPVLPVFMLSEKVGELIVEELGE